MTSDREPDPADIVQRDHAPNARDREACPIRRLLYTPDTGELRRGDARVALEHQPALVLAKLIAERGRLVTRAQLAASLWGDDTHVSIDDGLNYCIRRLRLALDDVARSPQFIETIPRRGYRFCAPVEDGVTPLPPLRLAVIVAALAALVAVVAAAESRPNSHHATAVAVARTLHDLVFSKTPASAHPDDTR